MALCFGLAHSGLGPVSKDRCSEEVPEQEVRVSMLRCQQTGNRSGSPSARPRRLSMAGRVGNGRRERSRKPRA